MIQNTGMRHRIRGKKERGRKNIQEIMLKNDENLYGKMHLYYSAWAAITKYHKLSGLNTNFFF